MDKELTIQEQIAKLVKLAAGRESPDEPFFRRITPAEAAAQILALPGLWVEAEDQKLPEHEGLMLSREYRFGYKEAQQEMLRAGWKKVKGGGK